MKNGIQPKIEQSLSATAERLSPGSGAATVKHFKNDLSTIGATKEDFNARYANAEVLVAAPAVFESKQMDGDPITFGKIHEGIVVAFADSILYVRRIGFGAREVKALQDITVEKVDAVVDGQTVAGLRIASHGKPKFVVAIHQPKIAANASQQAAVRDEIFQALAG